MRPANLIRLLAVSLLLPAAGCVCIQGRDCVGGACCNTVGCDGPVVSLGGQGCCDDGSGFRGPLGRLLGGGLCAGAGCGELYVDEWINEPPVRDNCGYGQCQQCCRAPVGSFLRALWGRQYVGGCDSCGCDGSSGHATGVLSSEGRFVGGLNDRGCNCSSAGQGGATHSYLEEGEWESQSTVPDSGGGVRHQPTPAPELVPHSAARLNPAMRRVIR